MQQPGKPIKAQGSSVFLCKIVFFDCEYEVSRSEVEACQSFLQCWGYRAATLHGCWHRSVVEQVMYKYKYKDKDSDAK